MAKNSNAFTSTETKARKKKTRQGLGRGTKFGSNKHSIKRYKKRYRGQGK